jgi:hypothetical protein
MILGKPDEIACWTEAGRNDAGGEVGSSDIEGGSVIYEETVMPFEAATILTRFLEEIKAKQ